MTPHRPVSPRHILRQSLCVCLLLSILVGCSSSDAARKDDSSGDELIGAPPSRDRDPFASQALPPESARAPTSGRMDIDPSSLPEDRSLTPRPATAQPAAPSKEHVEEAERESSRPPSSAVVTPPPAVEDPEVTASPSPRGTPPHRCFSCVRICPATDTTGDCSDSKEDMICGWGTALDEYEATKLARAQCDAALDMAREMPRFSRIDGACPVASCMAE